MKVKGIFDPSISKLPTANNLCTFCRKKRPRSKRFQNLRRTFTMQKSFETGDKSGCKILASSRRNSLKIQAKMNIKSAIETNRRRHLRNCNKVCQHVAQKTPVKRVICGTQKATKKSIHLTRTCLVLGEKSRAVHSVRFTGEHYQSSVSCRSLV